MSSHSEIRASISKPRGRHTATLFFLHGLGDVASGWFSELVHGAQQALPATLVGGLKIVCPQAPTRPITLNMGMKMPGWYDITSLSSRVADPCEGIDDSRKVLLSLIEAEINIHGIPPSRIIVGGFSQGAALSLYTGLQYPSQLGGIVALSGYLPKPEYLLKNLAPEAMSTPLFMGHGTADQIVRFEYGKQSFAHLKEAGLTNAIFHEFKGMEHSSCAKEMGLFFDFVRSRFQDSAQ